MPPSTPAPAERSPPLPSSPSERGDAQRRRPLNLRRVAAVVNQAGGGVSAGAAEEMKGILKEHSLDADVVCVGPGGLVEAVRAAAAARPDLLITLGGDGTARYAAGVCGAGGPLVAPLAGGTMNMLPYALYGRRPWQEALRGALSDGFARPIPGGLVDGKPFYVAAILGAPALWAPAREAVRRGALRAALLHARRALARAFKSQLRCVLDGETPIKGEAVAFISPLMTDACFDGSSLEAVALDPRHAADAFRIGFASLFGDWRSDAAVSSLCCRAARAHARHPIPCLLDGELATMPQEAEITFVADAFHALVGADVPALA